MGNKLSNIKSRVLQVARYKEVSYERFCENIGMTYGSFKGEAKKRPLNSDAIAIIISMYSDVNPDWLLTGVGEMLRNSDNMAQTFTELPTDPHKQTINQDQDLCNSIELLAHNKYLQKRLADLESEKERLVQDLDLKNELIKSFYEGRISYIPPSDQKNDRGTA